MEISCKKHGEVDGVFLGGYDFVCGPCLYELMAESAIKVLKKCPKCYGVLIRDGTKIRCQESDCFTVEYTKKPIDGACNASG